MKEKPRNLTIDAYIASCSPTVQPLLQEVRERLGEWIPGAEERISYGMPTFILGENVVHFAAYAKHLGFYPTSSAIAAFQGEFGSRKWAEGSLQFPLSEPMPWDLLERMVKFRVEEVKARAVAKRQATHQSS